MNDDLYFTKGRISQEFTSFVEVMSCLVNDKTRSVCLATLDTLEVS